MSIFSDYSTLSADPASQDTDINAEGLGKLRQLIGALPEEWRPDFLEAIKGVAEESRQCQEIFLCLKESLEQLRFDMKYLLFDLEATRRERDDYRRRLEDAYDF